MFFLLILLQIKQFEKTECYEERKKMAREIYDNFIMEEMLAHTYVSKSIRQDNLKFEISISRLLLNTLRNKCSI